MEECRKLNILAAEVKSTASITFTSEAFQGF